MRITLIALALSFTLLSACKSKKTMSENQIEEITEDIEIITEVVPSLNIYGPKAIVYKTKEDYFNHVPVIMNDDKTQILSYPHPTDLFPADKLLLPTPLNNGYFLDNKGINQNVAFLKYTYQEYSQMGNSPSMEDLMNNLLDTDPLLEMFDCGLLLEYENIEKQINEWIDSDKLAEKYIKLK